jgi:hypothetical protein
MFLVLCYMAVRRRATYQRLVSSGQLVPAADVPAPSMPQDLAAAVAQGKVTANTRAQLAANDCGPTPHSAATVLPGLERSLTSARGVSVWCACVLAGARADAHRVHHLRRPRRGAHVFRRHVSITPAALRSQHSGV